MPSRSGELINLGQTLVSQTSSYAAPEKASIPLALLISTSDEVAMILTAAGALRWTMRYRCEIPA